LKISALIDLPFHWADLVPIILDKRVSRFYQTQKSSISLSQEPFPSDRLGNLSASNWQIRMIKINSISARTNIYYIFAQLYWIRVNEYVLFHKLYCWTNVTCFCVVRN